MLVPNLTPVTTPPTEAERPSALDCLPGELNRRLDQLIEKMNKRMAKSQRESGFQLDIIKDVKEAGKIPGELINVVLAYLSSYGPRFENAAATIGSSHTGLLHLHLPRTDLQPSIGKLSIGGCASVRICGQRAARIGDVGWATSCGTFSPAYIVTTGSSSVFIGGARAARRLDLTRHCGTSFGFWNAARAGKLAAFGVKLAVKAAKKISEAVIKTATQPPTSSKPLFSRMRAMKARVEGDTALADALEAEADGHALALQVEGQQTALDAAAAVAGLSVGLDPGLPPCIGMILNNTHPSVLIGGIPLPDISGMLETPGMLFMGASKVLHTVVRGAADASQLDEWLIGKVKKARTFNAQPVSASILTGHPVDVVAGRFVVDAVDAELPGALPLRFARSYSSTWCDRSSPLGRGWSHSLDEAVWCEPGQLVWRADDGRELELPLADHEVFCPHHRVTIRPLVGGGWQLEDTSGRLRDFRPLAPSPERLARLLTIHDRRGHRIDLEYRGDRLVRAHTPDGRELRLHYDDCARLVRLDLPDPDGDGFVAHTRYTHDGDDLVGITDALGHTTHYRHDDHRIVEETLPGGLRFHFEYDGPGSEAACTRTRGDGGVLDHTLIYDRPRRTTMITNTCKEIAIVRHGARGEPLAVTDARGATTRYEYDDHLRRTAVHDPLGRTTRHTYDARGNCTRTVGPDGAATTVEYDRDLPVAATDPAGGRWRWSYDAAGRLTRRTDPLGRTTTYAHDGLVTLVTHPDGRRDRHTFHPSGALTRVDHADGRVTQHTYDRRGRLVRTDHPDGAHESFRHDLHGRPTRHDLPGGDVRHFNYDALGSLVRLCDARTDLRFTYTGLRWLASVGPIDAPPYTLERDLEGRVLRVADAGGTLLQADRDACGQLRVAVDARGHRRWTRDLAGRVTTLHHDAAVTRITRDLAGRVTAVHHPDGARDELTWRPDGALLTAVRHDAAGVTTLRRELDACGRLLREWQDDHWVALTHDLRDRPTHLRSSRGADVRLHHDDRGLARVTLPAADWAITSERDRHGREHARQLPGGVTAWWHRDPCGRPHEHGVTGSRPPQIHRHRRYTWSPDDRLLTDTDLTARPRVRSVDPPTCPIDQPALPLRHDALGRCIAAGPVRWQWCGDRVVHTLGDAAPTTWVSPTFPAATLAAPSLPTAPVRATPTAAPLLDPRRFSATSTELEPPLARLAADARHALLTDPTGLRTAFDERGAPVALPLDLPPAAPTLDIFGRPHAPSIALAIVTAELAPDLPDLAAHPPTTHPVDREAAILAAVFRAPP